MSSIVQPASFNVSKVSLTDLKPNPKIPGFKSCYTNYNGEMSLVMQTPSLPTPFGLSIYDKTTPVKYSVDIALNGYQENPKVKAFFNALEALDNWTIDQAVKNSKAWFGKERSRESLEDSYNFMLKWSKDKETGERRPYPPSLKLKLKKKYGTEDFACKFFDAKNKDIVGVPLEDVLVKRSEITCLIKCTGLYTLNGKFGLGWEAVQIRVDKMPSAGIGNGFAFQDAADEDDEPAERQFKSSGPAFSEPEEFGASGAGRHTTSGRSAPEEFSAKPAKKAPVVEDSESEEEEVAPPPVPKPAAPPAPAPAPADEESEEEEVAPAPVPKVVPKKVVTAKKVVAAGKK